MLGMAGRPSPLVVAVVDIESSIMDRNSGLNNLLHPSPAPVPTQHHSRQRPDPGLSRDCGARVALAH